ncbi:hypothetical protein [Streptomyces sp. NPDC021608]|uniref:hypothetical protein n=1 Tax=Streptomyces sp. NPDC021608 TaxID=3154903 RepID=UPI0033DA97BC
MVFIWALLVALGVLLFRALSQSPGSRPASGPETTLPGPRGAVAEQFLAERFARGQIDEEE